MKIIQKILPTLAAALSLAGCTTTISGTIPASADLVPHGAFRAGAAKVDITPVPGYPLAGHAIAAKISRGHWLRLQARAVFLEAPNGQRMVLVINDLFGLPAGLVDRVAEIVGHGPPACRIRRDAIVLAATHTHQGPGNYLSSAFYNQLASPKGGFDRELFDFLSQKIALAITQACESSQEAEAFFSTTRVKNFSKNRSLLAFLRNPENETQKFLADNADLPSGNPVVEYPFPQAYQAVDPAVRVLRLQSKSQPGKVIAMAAFVAVHPTAMGHSTAVYTSDLFGFAATVAEQEIQRQQGAAPVIAIFNGAEGDVSPEWFTHDRRDTIRLGNQLGDAILATRIAGQRVDGAINFRRTVVPIRTRAGTKAAAGIPLLGGAEDGRTASYYQGCVEGMTQPHEDNDADDPQDPKEIHPRDNCRVPFPIPILSSNVVTWVFPPPEQAAVGVLQIGPLAMITLPGEFTTLFGSRIRQAVTQNLTPAPADVLMIGLANEYLSYFTTHEEYAAQHYEGASTLYGKNSETIILDEVKKLTSDLNRGQPGAESGEDYSYKVGAATSFGALANADAFKQPLREDLGNILFNLSTGLPSNFSNSKFCWNEAASNYRLPFGVPAAAVETASAEGKWMPFLIDGIREDDQGTNLVFAVERITSGTATACIFWMPPEKLSQQKSYRFKVRTAAGAVVESPEFHLGN